MDTKKTTDFGATIYQPQNTPFDTLLICEEEGKDLVQVAAPILQKLEQENQIFTLNYHKGKLFICPRFKEIVNNKIIGVGSAVPIHYLDTEGLEFIKRIEKYVPMKREFNWGRFIP